MRSLMRSLLVLTLLAPLPARAQGSGADDALAKQYYKLGVELYDRSDYEGALKQFEKAYSHSKRPAFVYNMARCYEFMGKLKQPEGGLSIYIQVFKWVFDRILVGKMCCQVKNIIYLVIENCFKQFIVTDAAAIKTEVFRLREIV